MARRSGDDQHVTSVNIFHACQLMATCHDVCHENHISSQWNRFAWRDWIYRINHGDCSKKWCLHPAPLLTSASTKISSTKRTITSWDIQPRCVSFRLDLFAVWHGTSYGRPLGEFEALSGPSEAPGGRPVIGPPDVSYWSAIYERESGPIIHRRRHNRLIRSAANFHNCNNCNS